MHVAFCGLTIFVAYPLDLQKNGDECKIILVFF